MCTPLEYVQSGCPSVPMFCTCCCSLSHTGSTPCLAPWEPGLSSLIGGVAVCTPAVCQAAWGVGGGRGRSVSQLLQCDIYRHDMAHLTHPTCNLGPHPGTCDQYCLTQSQTSLCVLVSSPHRFLHELFPVWNWHQPVADFVLICLLCCIWLQLSSFLLKT